MTASPMSLRRAVREVRIVRNALLAESAHEASTHRDECRGHRNQRLKRGRLFGRIVFQVRPS
jgi:hypothetical protein